MSRVDSLPRLAVLIDAENISPRIAPRLFEEIATLGEASVRRIYGDFSEERLKGWAQILADHAIIPQQNFALTVGKNGSDIALVIDAMDLLHSGRFAGFCLVSSDSDFTRLAARIREHGLDVFGFGEAKTPKSFRQACKRFVLAENLLPRPEPATPAAIGRAAVGAAAAPPPSARKPRMQPRWSDAPSRNWRTRTAGCIWAGSAPGSSRWIPSSIREPIRSRDGPRMRAQGAGGRVPRM